MWPIFRLNLYSLSVAYKTTYELIIDQSAFNSFYSFSSLIFNVPQISNNPQGYEYFNRKLINIFHLYLIKTFLVIFINKKFNISEHEIKIHKYNIHNFLILYQFFRDIFLKKFFMLCFWKSFIYNWYSCEIKKNWLPLYWLRDQIKRTLTVKQFINYRYHWHCIFIFSFYQCYVDI